MSSSHPSSDTVLPQTMSRTPSMRDTKRGRCLAAAGLTGEEAGAAPNESTLDEAPESARVASGAWRERERERERKREANFVASLLVAIASEREREREREREFLLPGLGRSPRPAPRSSSLDLLNLDFSSAAPRNSRGGGGGVRGPHSSPRPAPKSPRPAPRSLSLDLLNLDVSSAAPRNSRGGGEAGGVEDPWGPAELTRGNSSYRTPNAVWENFITQLPRDTGVRRPSRAMTSEARRTSQIFIHQGPPKSS